MCTVCIISRSIKERVTRVKESHSYLRHISQTTEVLTNGVECQYMCFPVGEGKEPTRASGEQVTMLQEALLSIPARYFAHISINSSANHEVLSTSF